MKSSEAFVPGTDEHLAQFYDVPEMLAVSVGDFLEAGLRQGDAILLLVEEVNGPLILTDLRRRQLDVDGALRSGQLVHYPGASARESLLVNGAVDRRGFRELLESLLGPLLQRFPRVRAYGELVDYFCRAGEVANALVLEEVWHSYISQRPISLLCGYNLDALVREGREAFGHVCDAHHAVLPLPLAGSEVGSDPKRLVAELQHRGRMIDVQSRRGAELELAHLQLTQAQRRAQAMVDGLSGHLGQLQRITSSLSEAVTFRDVAQVVALEVASFVEAEQAVLATFEPESGRLILKGRLSAAERKVRELGVLPMKGDHPLARVFLSGDAVWPSRGIASIAPLLPGYPPPLALACVPLRTGGSSLGCLWLGASAPHALLATDRSLLEDVARQLALALERVRLYEELKESHRRTQLLASASAHLSAAKLDLDRILPALASEVTTHLADGCCICLAVEDGEAPSRRTFRHREPTLAPRLERLLEAPALEQLRRAGKQLLVPQATLDNSDPDRDTIAAAGVRSLMIVPLRASGRRLGALFAVRDADNTPFGDRDLSLLQELADRAGLAIDNAQNHQQLRQERQRLDAVLEREREAVRARDEFLSLASHELKTPLTSLKLQAQLLERAYPRASERMDERTRKFLDQTNRHVVRLARLIDDMLDISRIRSGKLSLQLETFDLYALVEEVAFRHGPLFSESGSSLEVTAGPGVVGTWDRYRLDQVLTNLLTNAARYGGSAPVQLVLERTETHAVLIVRDQGRGIAPEDHERIFRRFERAVSAKEISGLGLGLFIVRQILQMHGGGVRVDSVPQQGATFTVELPLDARALQPAESSVN